MRARIESLCPGAISRGASNWRETGVAAWPLPASATPRRLHKAAWDGPLTRGAIATAIDSTYLAELRAAPHQHK